MGYYKRMAVAAKLNGKTPEQFKAVAQKNAKATWFFAIIGGIVWYFTGAGWALIPFAIAVYSAICSFNATLMSHNIEKLGE